MRTAMKTMKSMKAMKAMKIMKLKKKSVLIGEDNTGKKLNDAWKTVIWNKAKDKVKGKDRASQRQGVAPSSVLQPQAWGLAWLLRLCMNGSRRNMDWKTSRSGSTTAASSMK